MAKLSGFDVAQLQPYRPEYLAGWRAEQYALDLMPAFGNAQDQMAKVQEGRCARDIGGDTHRSLSVANNYSHNTFKHVLLPVWIAAYRYNNKVYQFLVNGQTGEVVGVAPWSIWKIAALVLTILAIIGGIIAAVLVSENADSSSPAAAPTATATATATSTAPPEPPSSAPAAPTHLAPHAGPHAGPHPSGSAAPHPSGHPGTPHP
jgi:hypothetical protein